MIRFIDEHRDQFGVEAICRVLSSAVRGFITSRGYRAAKRRPPSARRLRDELLVAEVARLHAENYGVYGRRKMHALMRRQGRDVGRDQTERLMRLAGVRGVRKSRRVTGTVGDSFDNAMADAVNNLYKTELIRQQGPWRTVEQVELATLEWVWWWNNSRLHGELDMRTPIEIENAYYADHESANLASVGQGSR